MTDGTDGPTPDPGRPSPARRLDRAPGERYRQRAGESVPGNGPTRSTGASPGPASAPPGGGTAATGSRGRAVAAGSAAAVAGALVYAALGQITLGLGLLAVAGFLGWVVAIAIVWGAGAAGPIPRQPLVAALLGGGAIVVGLLLAWAWSRVEGGVLGPLEYADQRYGPIAYLEIAVAGSIAALRAR